MHATAVYYLGLEMMCINVTFILLARMRHMVLLNCGETGKCKGIIGGHIWLVL